MTGEDMDATYRFQLFSVVVFAYALVLKAFVVGSVVLFDCRGVEEFWIGSALYWAFVLVFGLMVSYAALPWWQQRSSWQSNQAESRWSLVATGFTFYVASWLLLLFAFLRPESLVGRIFASVLGFERGNWCS